MESAVLVAQANRVFRASIGPSISYKRENPLEISHKCAMVTGMKALRPILLLAGALCSVSIAFAADKAVVAAQAPASPVEVNFDNPAEFTDFTQSYSSRDYGQDGLMDQFREFLQERIAPRLAAGQRVVVTFKDIDLAGDFEPWRGPRADDIRIVKDIYVPRVKLEFRLLNADGTVAAEGQRDLKNLGFMMSSPFPQSDSLRWDKDMLNSWIRSEFPTKKK
jgi:hypothetical protein